MIEFFEVPTKRPRIMFTADEALKEALDRWAQKETRTISNLCEVVLRKAAIEAGYLSEAEELMSKQ